jgi:Protein of unknown function (DUF2442)
MINKIVEAKVLAPHVLRITFKDGYSAVHDFAAMSRTLSNMGEPLREPDYFARVFLEYGALTWPNGYDMCPDWLRREMVAAGELAQTAAE